MVTQLRECITFIEEQTGKPYDYDRLSEVMAYIKEASELRLEAMDAVQGDAVARPASSSGPISIAPVNFLPGGPEIVDYFADKKAEIAERVDRWRRRRPRGALPALLGRHHELEQDRLAGRQVRRLRRLRRLRPLHPPGVLAGAAGDRRRRPARRHGAELPDLPDLHLRPADHREDPRALHRLRHRRDDPARRPHLPGLLLPAVPHRRRGQHQPRHARRPCSKATWSTSPSTRTRS